jgi:signal transduction histidine kinase
MHDEGKTKDQLLAELFELRERVSHLEKERVERKQAEEAVKAERRHLFNVLESLPAMICLLTPDYQIAFANRAFRERFGESHGRHCYEYCFGRSEPCDFCEAYKVLETGLPHHWEVTAPDGSVIDVYDFPFTDVNGSPLILEMDIDITERKRTEEELRQSRGELEQRVQERMADLKSANEKLRQVPSRLIQAQEEERKRLAAELHDSIGQTLVALKFRIEHILAIFRKGKAKEALRVAEGFVSILQRSLDETRSIYMGLRPKVLEDFGAVAALMWYRNELTDLYPELHIEMDIRIEKSEIPDDLVVPIFRIAQEALNNVCRHSKAEWVDVRLALNDGAIELEIGDDGVGMDLEYIMESTTAKSLGLIGMRERAELIGGELTIKSAPGEGTTVRARWPLVPVDTSLVTS